jgi:hypothetical protein
MLYRVGVGMLPTFAEVHGISIFDPEDGSRCTKVVEETTRNNKGLIQFCGFISFVLGRSNVKLSLCSQLTAMPRRRMGEWRYSSTILDLGNR